MKAKTNTRDSFVRVSQAELLSVVANKIKDRVLFPKKVEEAKQILKSAKIIGK